MKKMMIFLLLFSVFPAVGQNAQISLNPFKKAALTTRDGSTVEGYARFNLSNHLVFKTDEEAEKEIQYSNNVSRISFFSEEGEETIYEYKVLDNKSKDTVLLELIEAGRMNLYKSEHTSVMPASVMGMGMRSSLRMKHILYYLSRNGEEIVIKINNPSTRSRKFRKAAKEFFGDCPSLMTRLNNKEFKRDGMEDVVEFYNKECGEAEI